MVAYCSCKIYAVRKYLIVKYANFEHNNFVKPKVCKAN